MTHLVGLFVKSGAATKGGRSRTEKNLCIIVIFYKKIDGKGPEK